MTIEKRIRELIQILGYKQKTFSKKVGVSAAVISDIVNEKTNVGGIVLTKIVSAFPEINTEWLIRGIGPVRKTEFSGAAEEPSIPYGSDLYNYHQLVKKVEELDRIVEELKKLTDKIADK